jgi:zinc protease
MKRLQVFILGMLVLVGAPLAASAQPALTNHTSPGGIPFRYAHMPRAQTQAIEFGWRNAYAMMLTSGRAVGVLGPAMILQGPKGMARGEFVEDIKDLQARFFLNANTHFTLGAIVSPPDKFDATVDLFAKTLSEPALDPSRLDELKQNHILSLKRASTTPANLPGLAATKLTLPQGPLLNWLVGDAASTEAVGMDDIEAWRKAVLVRDGLVIAAAGPRTAEEAAVQIDRFFAGLPAKGTSVAAVVPVETGTAKTIVIETATPQTILFMGSPSRYMAVPDISRGHLAMNIFRKRVFDAVRGKLGASYGATAQLTAFAREPFHFSVQSSVDHDKASDALEAMKAQHTAFLAEGVTEQELEPEKTRLISSFKESMSKPASLAQAVRTTMLVGYPQDYLHKNVARIGMITANEVNGDLRTKLAGNPVLTVIVAPSAAPFKADCVIKSLAEIDSCR